MEIRLHSANNPSNLEEALTIRNYQIVSLTCRATNAMGTWTDSTLSRGNCKFNTRWVRRKEHAAIKELRATPYVFHRSPTPNYGKDTCESGIRYSNVHSRNQIITTNPNIILSTANRFQNNIDMRDRTSYYLYSKKLRNFNTSQPQLKDEPFKTPKETCGLL